ncbi:transmembrane protein 14C-like protein [Mycotypha africana]|uniref:transmembrane protein 14C-like protein n=1 Tax=Mycotypha africana TaxID=64632 RepID=UPI002300B331|nr:transmembrane protein 14C-like protein [Mycotypha africana]KAI8984251.1 transmembrane protein 14C-like protein [Mycotypha africana]
MTDIAGYAYGAIVFAGGLVGYLKAGSSVSLLSGSVFGSLAMLGAYNVSNNPKNVYVGFLTSLALFMVMGQRFYNGRKFMPAGLVTTLSLIMFVRYGMRLI